MSIHPTARGSARIPQPDERPADRVSGRSPVHTRPGGGGPPRRKIRPRWGRIIGVLAVVLVLVVGGVSIGVWGYAKMLDRSLKRSDPFAGLTGDRPPKTADGALNILLLGSDSRNPDATTDAKGAWRTDTIMLLHVPRSHDKAYMISLPRDLWVEVPKSADGKQGGRRAKLNAAYAWGGAPLMVQTVEQYTGVRLDHVVVVDFWGFVKVTDALGGVDLYIERTIKSIHAPFRTFTKGTRHLNGHEALDYIRQRKQFPDGDFARMRHNQEFLKALMQKATDSGVMTNPGKLDTFLKSVTQSMTVDREFSLLDLAIQFRNLRPENLVFLVSPNKGTDSIDGESVIVSDKDKANAFFDAVKRDDLETWQRGQAAKPSSTPSR